MVLRGNRSFVLTTFGAQEHAMNGERSAIPYQFWFVPAACQQCWQEQLLKKVLQRCPTTAHSLSTNPSLMTRGENLAACFIGTHVIPLTDTHPAWLENAQKR